jgi:hypothetical protein
LYLIVIAVVVVVVHGVDELVSVSRGAMTAVAALDAEVGEGTVTDADTCGEVFIFEQTVYCINCVIVAKLFVIVLGKWHTGSLEHGDEVEIERRGER